MPVQQLYARVNYIPQSATKNLASDHCTTSEKFIPALEGFDLDRTVVMGSTASVKFSPFLFLELFFIIGGSISDPCHFGMDPDPQIRTL